MDKYGFLPPTAPSLVIARETYMPYSLLYGLPQTMLQRLQRVQNYAARHTKTYDRVTLVQQHLNWLPVCMPPTYKVLLYSVMHDQAPCNLAELLTLR